MTAPEQSAKTTETTQPPAVETALDDAFRALTGEDEGAEHEGDHEPNHDHTNGSRNTGEPTPEPASQASADGKQQAATSPTSTATSRNFQRLSSILEKLPDHQRLLIIRNFPSAISKGQFKAVQLDETFEARYQIGTGQIRTSTLHDELILVTPEFETWMAQQIKENEYVLLQGKANFTVGFNRVMSGELDFCQWRRKDSSGAISVRPPAKCRR